MTRVAFVNGICKDGSSCSAFAGGKYLESLLEHGKPGGVTGQSIC